MIQGMPPAPPRVVSIGQLDAKTFPAIVIDGKKMRIVALTVVGDPAIIQAALSRVTKNKWAISVVSDDGRVMQISAGGKSLEQFAALDFQFQRGDFGDLRSTPFIIDDFK